MKRYTITTNIYPIEVMDMHLVQTMEYIKENNLQVLKVEEHIKHPNNPTVIVEMREISINQLLG